MRYSSQREYLKIAEGVLLAVLALVGYVAVVQPKLLLGAVRASSRSACPTGVLVLLGLLMASSSAGTRFLVAPRLRAPVARLPRARATRARC